MAVIHHTTMTPTKLELLTTWLPSQPWFVGIGREPDLTRAGGFRLDDPDGEVGIEFMVVIDSSGDGPTAYHVPMTYRGSALVDGDDGLIGTSEHGVLGKRWIYDGAHDPVLIAQLVELIQGVAQPQAQSKSDTPDPTVHRQPLPISDATVLGTDVVGNGSDGTDIQIRTSGTPLGIRINRILEPAEIEPGSVSATWAIDDKQVRGTFAAAFRRD